MGEEILPFDDACIMFQDEDRFGRINSPHRCWVKGERPEVYCQTVREYTYAFVAVCSFDGNMVSLIMPWANAKTMNIHLAEISKRNRDKHILMFVDKAGWHIAKDLQIPKNIRLVPILPYSPELNPSEHIFDELREKYFHNLFFNSMSAVEDRLEVGLRDLENNGELLQSITGFNWVISCI